MHDNSINQYKVICSPIQSNEIQRQIQSFVSRLSTREQSLEYYATHRNTTMGKASKDNYVGKLGEFLTSQYLVDRGFPLLQPDLTVYTTYQKNWSPDLPYAHTVSEFPNVHVKSIDAPFDNQYSWLFQCTDPIFQLPGTTTDLICFVFVDTTTPIVQGAIKAILPWRVLNDEDGQLRYQQDPILSKHKGYKVAFYMNTFIKYRDRLASEYTNSDNHHENRVCCVGI